MNIQPRISYLAITSLVFGMAFYVPLITGILAFLTGILAITAIRNSNQMLLGQGVAIAGIVLGISHSVVWALIFFAGLTYTVDVGNSAVVSRDGKPTRVEELGVHYKIPFYESVTIFPTAKIFSFKSNPGKLILKSRKTADINYELLWTVCDPARTYNQIGKFDASILELRLSYLVKDKLRMAAAHSKDVQELATNTNTSYMKQELKEDFGELGLCLNFFLIPFTQNSK